MPTVRHPMGGLSAIKTEQEIERAACVDAGAAIGEANAMAGADESGARVQTMPRAVRGGDMVWSGLDIAIVHDWCPSWRGGERVAAGLARLSGARTLYTLFDFLDDELKAREFAGVAFKTSPAQRLPSIERYYRALFFACPFLIEQFDVTRHDAVISSSAAFARGIITRPDQPHLCYVHSPVRYAWDEQFSYLEQARMGWGPKALLYRRMLYKLRQWDTRTAHGPDLMVANSTYVAGRIRRTYGREARVVFPPVDVDAFPLVEDKDDYYVTASFLAPYKRTDLVIEAFRQMPDKRLLVVGDGQQANKLMRAPAPNVTFTGYLSQDRYVDAVSRAKALVFAGCEDFGIALAEAQAAGTALIAFGRGGASDIVAPLDQSREPTGILFGRQTVEALKAAVATFEARSGEIAPEACRANAVKFGPQRFNREMSAALDAAIWLNRGMCEPVARRRSAG